MLIFEKIMQHLDFLECLLSATHGLEAATRKNKIDLIEQITDNRDRLINIIKALQSGIEDDIANADKRIFTTDVIEILKSWSNEVNNLVQVVDQKDREISLLLENLKSETSKEIGSIYKSRNSIRNYQSSIVKG